MATKSTKTEAPAPSPAKPQEDHRWHLAVDDTGVAITDLRVTEPTLETVFIHLTGKELRD